jgi:hypothetical protein
MYGYTGLHRVQNSRLFFSRNPSGNWHRLGEIPGVAPVEETNQKESALYVDSSRLARRSDEGEQYDNTGIH